MKFKCLIIFLSAQFATLLISGQEITRVSLGFINDSLTNFSEHYGIYEFLKANPIQGINSYNYALSHKGKELYLKGTIGENSSKILFFRNGRISDTLTLTYSSKDLSKIYILIRSKIASLKNGESTFSNAVNFKPVDKNLITYQPLKSNYKYAIDYLPIYYSYTVPYSKNIRELSVRVGFKIKSDFSIYNKINQDITKLPQVTKALYNKKEESFYFIKNPEIPYNYVNNLKSLIFPIYKRPGAVLSYISVADTLLGAKQYTLSAMCYQSALRMIATANCSDFQKYAMKYEIYNGLENAYKELGYNESAKLSNLIKLIIDDYLKDLKSIELYNAYVNLLQSNGDKYDKLEYAARKARNNRSIAVIGATLNAASGIATGIITNDTQIGDIYVQQSLEILDKSYEEDRKVLEAIQDYSNKNRTVGAYELEAIDAKIILENNVYDKEIFVLLRLPYYYNTLLNRLDEFSNIEKDDKLKQLINICRNEPFENVVNFQNIRKHVSSKYSVKAFKEIKE